MPALLPALHSAAVGGVWRAPATDARSDSAKRGVFEMSRALPPILWAFSMLAACEQAHGGPTITPDGGGQEPIRADANAPLSPVQGGMPTSGTPAVDRPPEPALSDLDAAQQSDGNAPNITLDAGRHDAGSPVDLEDAGVPHCMGTHVPCSAYAPSDEPTSCTRHGCTWHAGACHGTPHSCADLALDECATTTLQHRGCTLR